MDGLPAGCRKDGGDSLVYFLQGTEGGFLFPNFQPPMPTSPSISTSNPATPGTVQYEQKGCATAISSVKQVDVESRVVSGYYADFESFDSDGEKFAPGAFAESIAAWGPQAQNQRIKHLHQHSPYNPIGMPRVLREDDRGLYFETEIIQTGKGDEVLAGYALGLYEHSVGFNRMEQDPSGEGTTITKAWLWEGSNVTWGSNENTPFLGFKSIHEAHEYLDERVKKLIEFMEECEEFAEKHQLELALFQLQAEIKRLDRYDLRKTEEEQTQYESGKDAETPPGSDEREGRKEASNPDDEAGSKPHSGSKESAKSVEGQDVVSDDEPVQIKMPTGFFDLDRKEDEERESRDETPTFFTTTN